MGSTDPPVSDAELEVLKALWEDGPGTVRDLDARLKARGRTWAYTTVLTLLTRLRDKGHVAGEKDGGRSIRFRAAVSRDELLRSRLAELADRICDGVASPLVHALVEGGAFTPGDIAGFRRLLDELEAASPADADADAARPPAARRRKGKG